MYDAHVCARDDLPLSALADDPDIVLQQDPQL